MIHHILLMQSLGMILVLLTLSACSDQGTVSIFTPTSVQPTHTAPKLTNTLVKEASRTPTYFDETPQPYVVSMRRLSLTQGWVLTDKRLLWTNDAGRAWRDITPADVSNCLEAAACNLYYTQAFFLDASQAWLPLVKGKEEAPPTTLSALHTEDGGKNWVNYKVDEFPYSRTCPSSRCLSDIELDFVDSKNGWLVASAPLGGQSSDAFLYRTRDGGRTWIPLSIPIVGWHIAFLDSLNGWTNGGKTRWISDQLLRTRDGGDSWKPVNLVLPEEYAMLDGYEYQEPVFLSDKVGVLPVRFYKLGVGDTALGFYTTWDGGGTWSLSATIEDPNMPGVGIPIPWFAIDKSTWYVYINNAIQYLTHDRGQTWETFPASGLSDYGVNVVQFVSELEGWGIAQKGTGCCWSLFATHDGGRTWTMIIPLP